MAEGNENTGTILQKKKKAVKLSKAEVLLMLRAYQAHPTNWSHIIEEIKDNMDRLPEMAKDMYRSSTGKHIRDRLSNKFGKLMCEKRIQDDDIRMEVEAISRMEERLVQTSTVQKPSTTTPQADIRDNALLAFSDSDDGAPASSTGQQIRTAPPDNSRRATPHQVAAASADTEPQLPHAETTQAPQQRRQAGKRPLMDIVRENQLHYNKFITKKYQSCCANLALALMSPTDGYTDFHCHDK